MIKPPSPRLGGPSGRIPPTYPSLYYARTLSSSLGSLLIEIIGSSMPRPSI